MKIFPAVKPTILVVDDEASNLSLVSGLLRDNYLIKTAKEGVRAIQLAQQEQPDLILLDVMMPGINGYEVCRLLKADSLTCNIPVLFLTSQSEMADEGTGLNLGAVDYITRPINPGILSSRVHAHLAVAHRSRSMQISNEYLEFEVAKRTRQISSMQDMTILAMASLAETRDVDTGNHLRRTQNYVRALALQLRRKSAYVDVLTDEVIDLLYKCAPLHDIGKVGIPDRILHKPGRYEPEEFEVMKRHPALGRDALESARQTAGNIGDFFEVAKDVVYSHHERWDGTGYPQGLAAQAIPLVARIMALADVYDALISPRIYKPGMPHEEAADIIVAGSARHFDPEVVDAFLDLSFEFRAIADRYADSDQDLTEKANFVISAIGPL